MEFGENKSNTVLESGKAEINTVLPLDLEELEFEKNHDFSWHDGVFEEPLKWTLAMLFECGREGLRVCQSLDQRCLANAARADDADKFSHACFIA